MRTSYFVYTTLYVNMQRFVPTSVGSEICNDWYLQAWVRKSATIGTYKRGFENLQRLAPVSASSKIGNDWYL